MEANVLHDTAPGISVEASIPSIKSDTCRELKTHTHPCRESIATYISQELALTPPEMFSSENLLKGSSKINFTFIYPETSREKLRDGRFKESLADKDIFFALQSISRSEEKKRDLVRLIDCFVGPISLLIAGPLAFKREKITEFSSSKSPQVVYTKNGSEELSCERTNLHYSRLAPFWLKNSVAVSVILGALRNAFELFMFGEMHEGLAKKILLEEREAKFLEVLNKLEGKSELAEGEVQQLSQIVRENFSIFDESWECLARPLNSRTLKALDPIVKTCRELNSTWHIKRPVDGRGIIHIGLYQWMDKHSFDRGGLFNYYPSNVEFGKEEVALLNEISKGVRNKPAPPRVYIDRFYY